MEASEPPEPVSDDGPRQVPRQPLGARVRNGVVLGLLAAVAFAAGLLVFDHLVMPQLVHRGGEVRVPDLADLTFEQAEKALQPLGLKVSRAGERFDARAPRGRILDQDPLPDTPVRGRKLVSVIVSLGEESGSVPALGGESLRSARTLLERAGPAVGGITRAPSEELPAGLVVASDPPAETVLPRGALVGLLVSSGSGEESFVMPDLLGREIGAATRQLEALGFQVDIPAGAGAVGAILFQNPGAGSRITRASRIVLQATGRIIR